MAGYDEWHRIHTSDWAILDPNQKVGASYPLLVAVMNHSSFVVLKLLLHGANPNAKDDSGETPLMLAVRDDLEGIAELLVQYGAEPMIGTTPLLHWTARYGHVGFLNLLLKMGVDVNATDATGKTAMHMAGGDPFAMGDVIYFLESNGANLEARDFRGLTPFLYSIILEGGIYEYQWWKQSGADLHAIDVDGNNALHLLIQRERFGTIPALKPEDVLDEMIDGFEVDPANLPSTASLMFAWLLREGVNPESENRWGHSASDLMEGRDVNDNDPPGIRIFLEAIWDLTPILNPFPPYDVIPGTRFSPKEIEATRFQIYFKRSLTQRLLTVLSSLSF